MKNIPTQSDIDRAWRAARRADIECALYFFVFCPIAFAFLAYVHTL